MVTSNIDLGQMIISGAIGLGIYFGKRLIDQVERRLDKHEEVIFDINSNVQKIMGSLEIDRRRTPRNG